MVLPTSLEYGKGLVDMVHKLEGAHGSYGFSTCYYGHDEQSIAHFLSVYDKGPRLDWRAVDPRYGFIIGKYGMLNGGGPWQSGQSISVPYTIHYINHPKPWVSKEKWQDLDIWWAIAMEFRDLNPGFSWEGVNLNMGRMENVKRCYYCETFFPNKGVVNKPHRFTDCPSLSGGLRK